MGLRTDFTSLAAIGVGTIGALGATALFAVAGSNYDADNSSCISVRSIGSTVAIDMSNLEDTDSRAVVISPDVRVEAECIALREEVEARAQEVRVRVRDVRERADEVRVRADEMRLRMDEVRAELHEIRLQEGLRIEADGQSLDIDEAELRASLESLRELEALEQVGIEVDLDVDALIDRAVAKVREERVRRDRGGN